MISEPPKNTPINTAGKPAITISIALRKTWPYNTLRSDRPLARAVTTYCFLISSRKLFLVSNVSVAKAEMVEASTGSVMCQK